MLGAAPQDREVASSEPPASHAVLAFKKDRRLIFSSYPHLQLVEAITTSRADQAEHL